MKVSLALVASLFTAACIGQGRPDFHWIKGGHTRPVGVETSADGKLLVTGSDDGTVKVWRIDGGRLLLTIPGLGNMLTDVDISSDGTLIATTGWDNTLKIFRVHDGSLVRTINPVHVYPSSIDFSPDGQFIASCGEDSTYPSSSGSAKIWKVSDGSLVRTLPYSNIVQANNLRYSPDGQYLAVAGGHIDIGGAPLDCKVKVFRSSDGVLETTFAGHVDPVVDVRWHPNGDWIVSGGIMDDNAIRIWQRSNGAVIKTFVEQNELNDPQFTPDGQFLMNGFDWSSNKKVKVRRVSDWTTVNIFPANNMASLQASRDSQTYFVGGDNYGEPLRQFRLSDGALLQNFSAHWEAARVVRYSHDGSLIASGGAWPESRVNIWNAETGDLLRRIFHQDQGINDISFSPDDSRIVVGSGDSAVIFDVATGAPLATMQHEGVTVVTAVEYSPDGQWIATANSAGKVRIWTSSGTLVNTVSHLANDLDFSPDGSRLVSGGGTTFIVWNSPSLTQVNGQNNWPDNIYSIDWSPDGQTIVTGDSSGKVELWSASTFGLIRAFAPHAGETYVTRFSPDGSMVITGGSDGIVRLNRVSDGAVLRTWNKETVPGIMRIDFSPNGSRFAIARTDGTIGVANTFSSSADSFTLVRGRLNAGGLIDMLESDNLSAVFVPGVTFSSSQAPVEISFESRVQWPAPSQMTVTFESSGTSSNLQQTIELFDFAANAWVPMDTRQLSVNETNVTLTLNADIARFIQAGTQIVRARSLVRANGPVFAYPWQYKIDRVNWSIVR